LKDKISIENKNSISNFLDYLKVNKKLFFPSILQAYENNKELFSQLGSLMLNWAKNFIGKDYEKILADGYSYFVVDVNKSQMAYEKSGKYRYNSYREVYDATYNNSPHMQKYHWGVYVTTFAWEHHLLIYRIFKEMFISRLDKDNINIIELGSGSGIWGFLVMSHLPDSRITGIDISSTSVHIARDMAVKNHFGNRSNYMIEDALAFKGDREYDAGISCFLMEHLENPQILLDSLCSNLKTGGYAFVTCALTASEVDHIREFRRESEVVLMAEKAGFRVISIFSSAPKKYSPDYKFLPRSMALILQKRHNDIW
jgi:ubiquinone/menaquinone biosynthesis C-methylase UbiE